jgi:hypothetical protein
MIEKLINYNNMYTTTTTSNQNLNMVSLFDYLGHAAGKDLGKSVAYSAKKDNIPTQTRYVSNKKYQIRDEDEIITAPIVLKYQPHIKYEELQKALNDYESDDDSVDDFETISNRNT